MAQAVETVESSELAVIAKGTGLEQNKVEGLLAKFVSPFKQAQYIINESRDILVTSEDQTTEMEEAKVARLELKHLRVDTEKTRKELKEQSLREGKAIDGMANIIKALIVPVEEHLEKQEKFAINLAAERRARRIAEHREMIAVLGLNADMYKFEDMDDSQFAVLMKQLRDAKKAEEELERRQREAEAVETKKVEAERLAKEKAAAEEAEHIRKENAKLKADYEAREAELAKERAADQKRLDAERAEQEKKLAAERATAEAERKKREALEAEQAAKKQAEAKAKADTEEAQRQSLLAPDKDKLNKFANVIDAIELPNVSNREAGKVLDETKDYLTRISKNLRAKAAQL